MSTTIIEEIIAGIVTVGDMAVGITRAIDPPPANLDSASLPCLCVFTGPSEDDDEAAGDHFVVVQRTYRILVPVLPVGQGNPNTRERLIRPLIEAVKTVYRAHPQLNGVDWVQNSQVAGDSGAALLMEWGAKYIGFELRLRVTSLEPRNMRGV